MNVWKGLWGVSILSSLEFIPEIMHHAPGMMRGGLAFVVQVVHDYVCFLFPMLVISCMVERSVMIRMYRVHMINILYTMVMACFAYHKRCFLTLWYNDLLALDRCNRYLPIWQRVINHVSDVVRYDSVSTCDSTLDDYRNTYLWLNDQILFSILILCMNLMCIRMVSPLAKKDPTGDAMDEDVQGQNDDG